VVASLLVSVVLLGFKLSAAKRLVQVNQRRAELTSALVLLQPKLEDEDLAVWLDDCDHDAKHRQARISEMALPSGRAYGTMEMQALERCQGMFDLFDGSSGTETQLKLSAAVKRTATKYDGATRLLLGFSEAEIRADPLSIVAYILDYPGSRVGQTEAAANPNKVRAECLEHVNPHQTIGFARYKAYGMSDRTFLYATVAKQVGEDPRKYVVVVTPIPRHDKISQKDEAGAVRAENCRSFRLTEVAPGVTSIEYCCSLDLKGLVPQIVTNTIALPIQMNGAQPWRCTV
jgi:hypothetical protein